MRLIDDRELDLLDFYRASELHGALLLAHLARRTGDPALLCDLSRHAADEMRHAAIWAEVIVALGGSPQPRKDTYQSHYAAVLGRPGNLLETLALTQVFERRVQIVYQRHLRAPGTHALVKQTLQALLEDEKRHLVWVKRWLDQQPGDVRGALRRYQEADRAIAARLSEELLGERQDRAA